MPIKYQAFVLELGKILNSQSLNSSRRRQKAKLINEIYNLLYVELSAMKNNKTRKRHRKGMVGITEIDK